MIALAGSKYYLAPTSGKKCHREIPDVTLLSHTHTFSLAVNDKAGDFHSLHLAVTLNEANQRRVLNV